MNLYAFTSVHSKDNIYIHTFLFPVFQWDRLLADIGGLLGLFVGISACTAVELFEFIVDISLLTGKLMFRKSKANIYPAKGPNDNHRPNGATSSKVIEHVTHS
jgi:hypothetical protein